jgi:hypothetical protein
MINRFISMKEDYIDIVNLVQKYPLPSDMVLYNFYCKRLYLKVKHFLDILNLKKTQ